MVASIIILVLHFTLFVNEKAPVSQRTKSPERREPVISVTGHPWYHSLCCTKSTAALHDRLFKANRCPYNGGLPSGPTVCFSPAAQGPVTETLRTALHRPAVLCTDSNLLLILILVFFIYLVIIKINTSSVKRFLIVFYEFLIIFTI